MNQQRQLPTSKGPLGFTASSGESNTKRSLNTDCERGIIQLCMSTIARCMLNANAAYIFDWLPLQPVLAGIVGSRVILIVNRSALVIPLLDTGVPCSTTNGLNKHMCLYLTCPYPLIRTSLHIEMPHERNAVVNWHAESLRKIL